MTDAEVLQATLVENLQREDLNPLHEAQGNKHLIDKFGKLRKKSRPLQVRAEHTSPIG